MAIYITWDEQENRFQGWRVIPGGLGTEPIFKTFTVKRKARYSSSNDANMLARAKAYIKSDMQDKINVKAIIIKESD